MAQDALDCSAAPKYSEMQIVTPLQIAQGLDSFGIGFFSSAQMTPIPTFRVTKGESVFRAVERACREQGLTLCGRPGGVELWSAKTQPPRHAGGLVEGVNIEIGEADHDSSNRHSEIRVHGQAARGHGAGATQIEGLSVDATIARYRPKIIAHEGDTNPQRALGKAQSLRDRAAGEGIKALVSTPVWRDEVGTLWTPGYRIWTESPFLDVTQDMVVEHLIIAQDAEAGTEARLGLVDPRAYGGAGGKGDKSGSGWKMPSDS